MLPDSIYRVGVLCRHNATLLARDPGPVLSYIVLPIVLMTVLGPLYDAALGDGSGQRVAPGMVVMFSLFAMGVVGSSFLSEQTWHTWPRLCVTSARPVELLLGKTLPLLGVLLTQQVVLLTFSGVTARWAIHGPLWLLAIVALAWAICIVAAGGALAMVVRTHGQLGTASDIGAMSLTCLGGALVPLETMGEWARTLAPASPGYWGVTAFRSALAGDVRQSLIAAGVLIVTSAGLIAVAAWRLRKGWGSSRASFG